MTLSLKPFDIPALEIKQLLDDNAGGRPSRQIDYIAGYLSTYLGAKSAIVETDYVDRHYVEEYSAHYARLLHPPPKASTRLHFFQTRLTEAALDDALQADSAESMETLLQGAYLGFVVLRPLPDTPVGRTILAVPSSEGANRQYSPAWGRHLVHLFGVELTIRGLPFQQQDVAVGACATTALWSMLAGCVRRDGGRTPTPGQVRQAASRRHRGLGPGLDKQQIADAIHAFGRRPVTFKTLAGADNFSMHLQCYLRSALPILLEVKLPDGEHHAMVVAGFRGPDDDEPAGPLCWQTGAVTLRMPGMTRIYAHDDNHGPYERFTIRDSDAEDENPVLVSVDRDGLPIHLRGEIQAGTVALYPKVRLTAAALLRFAAEWWPIIEKATAGATQFECSFELGGRYLESLYATTLTRAQRRRLMSDVQMSRYVGVVQFFVADDRDRVPLADLVYDTSDIDRDDRALEPLLAVVPFVDALRAPFEHELKTRRADCALL